MSRYGFFSHPYFSIFSLSTGKYGPEKTPYLDTFYTVHGLKLWSNFRWVFLYVWRNQFVIKVNLCIIWQVRRGIISHLFIAVSGMKKLDTVIINYWLVIDLDFIMFIGDKMTNLSPWKIILLKKKNPAKDILIIIFSFICFSSRNILIIK